jgi:hypothetical protein
VGIEILVLLWYERKRILNQQSHFLEVRESNMKHFFGIAVALAILVSIKCMASDYEYEVSGNSEESEYVFGEIEANKGEKEVEGYLYDENGNEVYFEGEWTGYGDVEGYDEDGNYIELEVD